jgi:hypothetical protein
MATSTGDRKVTVILTPHPVKPTISQRLICRFQQGVPFTHAALYLSNDPLICEATPGKGVVFSDLEDKLKKSCLLVRRIPGIGDRDRERMAKAAADLRGHPYAFDKVFQKARERLRKSAPSAFAAAAKGVICSTLCEHAILMGTRGTVQIRKFSNQVILPADLFASDALVDVNIGWRRVAQGRGLAAG